MTPEERIGAIADWASREPGVEGLILLGSRARSHWPADEWSDIDLLLVATDPDRWIGDPGWVGAFGRPVLTFVEPTLLRDRSERRVLYDDGGDVDVVPISPDDVEALLRQPIAAGPMRRGHRLLFDPGGRLAARIEAGLAESPPAGEPAAHGLPSHDEFANVTADFWYHALWAARKLRRGELWTAKGAIDAHMKWLLRRLLEWDALSVSGGDQDVWFEGRFLERWARPEPLARLRGTFADYDPDALGRALVATMALFRELATALAERHALPYPTAADSWVGEEVRRLLGEGDA